MEPWIQPTTAPHQPDLTDEGQSLDDEEVLRGERATRVERGWMEAPRYLAEPAQVPGDDSIAITVMTVAVVVAFLLLMIFFFPFLLLATW